MDIEILECDEGEYSITSTDLDRAKQMFEKYDVVPTGHAWERLVIAFCDEKGIEMDSIDFDSESDMFAAYSNDKMNLRVIADVFENLLSKPKELVSLLEDYEEDEGGLFSVEEFIEHLELNGIDDSKPIFVFFSLIFQSDAPAISAAETASRDGYTCYIGLEYNDNPIEIRVELVPSEEKLEEIVQYMSGVAKKYDGVFDYYDYDEKNSFDELEHWHLFKAGE